MAEATPPVTGLSQGLAGNPEVGSAGREERPDLPPVVGRPRARAEFAAQGRDPFAQADEAEAAAVGLGGELGAATAGDGDGRLQASSVGAQAEADGDRGGVGGVAPDVCQGLLDDADGGGLRLAGEGGGEGGETRTTPSWSTAGRPSPRTASGRTESLYHPLPRVGTKADVTCPTGLKAVPDARLTCTGKRSDGTTGTTVDIAVRVVRVVRVSGAPST